MTGLLPYSSYVVGNFDGERFVEVRESKFHSLLRSLVSAVQVDEEWYRQTYGDVAAAIEHGELRSAREHYVNVGYFEDRLPHRVIVDEKWYLAEYPDVAEAVEAGSFPSAQHHFVRNGFKEGRLPSAGWSLAN